MNRICFIPGSDSQRDGIEINFDHLVTLSFIGLTQREDVQLTFIGWLGLKEKVRVQVFYLNGGSSIGPLIRIHRSGTNNVTCQMGNIRFLKSGNPNQMS